MLSTNQRLQELSGWEINYESPHEGWDYLLERLELAIGFSHRTSSLIGNINLQLLNNGNYRAVAYKPKLGKKRKILVVTEPADSRLEALELLCIWLFEKGILSRA